MTVAYESRDFVGWWLFEQNRLKLKKPTISRLDHAGNYEFGNIKLEERYENCVTDVLKRHGSPGLKIGRAVAMYKWPTMKLLNIFPSVLEASRETLVKHSNIWSMCCGKTPNGRKYLKTKDNFTFRFLDGGR